MLYFAVSFQKCFNVFCLFLLKASWKNSSFKILDTYAVLMFDVLESTRAECVLWWHHTAKICGKSAVNLELAWISAIAKSKNQCQSSINNHLYKLAGCSGHSWFTVSDARSQLKLQSCNSWIVERTPLGYCLSMIYPYVILLGSKSRYPITSCSYIVYRNIY